MDEPKLEFVSVSECKIDAENPNQMNPKQMAALKASIEQFGNLQPIVIDQHSNVVDGAHRLQAYVEMKKETIPALRVTINSDADRRIIRQTMNKLRGTHDPAKDALEFVEILRASQEKKLFEVSNIRETDFYKTIGLANKEQNQDQVPELPETPVTQPGDMWIMGEGENQHRILCGDSTKAEDVAKLMQGDKAHIVVTDPPYGVSYTSAAEGRDGGNKWKPIENDDLRGSGLQLFCEKFMEQIKLHTTEDSAYYVWFGMKTFHHLLASFDKLEIYYALPLIWVKSRPTISWAKYHPDYEVQAYAGNGAKGNRFAHRKPAQERAGSNPSNYSNQHETGAFAGNGAKPSQPRWFAKYDQTTCWFIKPDGNNSYLHPTFKPVELAERALLNSSREGEICLDLFAGAGFSLIACHKLKRRWRGMELEPQYVDVCVKRWSAYSGLQAKLIRDDKEIEYQTPQTSGVNPQQK